MHAKTQDLKVSPPVANLSSTGQQRTDDETRDYEEFLEKARKDAEKAEKKKLREIKAAREVNLSPFASGM
jgi:hypothetical protein